MIKREKDLAILKLFNELSGNDQKSEGKGEEVGENENQWLNEKLVSLISFSVLNSCMSSGDSSLFSHDKLFSVS